MDICVHVLAEAYRTVGKDHCVENALGVTERDT